MQRLKSHNEYVRVEYVRPFSVGDFLGLVDIVKSNCEFIEVTVGRFRLDDPVSEIKQLQEALGGPVIYEGIKIEGGKFYGGAVARDQEFIKRPPQISLSVSNGSASMYYDGEDIVAKGLSSSILE